MVPSPRWSSVKRRPPIRTSRMIRTVHFSPMSSDALAIGQNWPYSIAGSSTQSVVLHFA
jgi:hypothetical protein